MEASEDLREKVRTLIEERNLRELREILLRFGPADIAEFITGIDPDEKAVVFRILPQELANESFGYLEHDEQTALIGALGESRVASILNEMPADDRTALLEECPPEVATGLMSLLSAQERHIAISLLGYPENSVGRLMTPDYLAVRAEWSVEQVLAHVREHGRDTDVVNILYVVDEARKLIGDVRIRDILLAPLSQKVGELRRGSSTALGAYEDQESAVELFRKYDRTALPVVDSHGHMIGIVTVDDVLDVAEEEATEDIQKLGGVEALEAPYISLPLFELIGKRAPWLVVLFVGEMLTATAMGYFEDEIERMVVLALFIPLIISSGGNSGSQAATLVIRALALGEVEARDWWRVLKRELISGLCLGLILAVIGYLRIAIWSSFTDVYGPHWQMLGVVVGVSLLSVVLWGTLTGALFPLLLYRIGLDPATSSAPFVATIVDVTGVIIYFTVASLLLGGILL